MGYLKKNDTICNPAKKNDTIFQNSFQETYYVTEQQSYQVVVPIYGHVGWRSDEAHAAYQGSAWNIHNDSDIPIRVVNNGFTTTYSVGMNICTPYTKDRLETPKVYNANTGAFIAQATNYDATVQIGSRQEIHYRDVQVPKTRTNWNIKWKKLSA